MWIVEFNNYKTFLKAVIKNSENNGIGQQRRLAELLNVSPIQVSMVLKKERHFSPGQALEIAKFFSFDEKTTEYFIYMVNMARADTKPLRDFYALKLERLKKESQKVKNVVIGKPEITDTDKGRFYSNWFYSGIRLLSSIEGYQTIDSMASYFGLSRAKVADAVGFLVKSGLCVEEQGQIGIGPKSTHVDSSSDFVNSHRRNWREKALERFTEPESDEMFFSGPVSLSAEDAEVIHNELLALIKNFSRRVGPSNPETLRCLNIDWFKF